MNKGIFSVINHFEKSLEEADSDSTTKLARFQGRFMQLWGDLDVLQKGRQLIGVNPNTWFPFADEQEIQVLERIDDSTLKIKRAGGYASEGELVKYEFDQSGAPKFIKYAGYDLRPEAEYNAELARIKSEKKLLEARSGADY